MKKYGVLLIPLIGSLSAMEPQTSEGNIARAIGYLASDNTYDAVHITGIQRPTKLNKTLTDVVATIFSTPDALHDYRRSSLPHNDPATITRASEVIQDILQNGIRQSAARGLLAVGAATLGTVLVGNAALCLGALTVREAVTECLLSNPAVELALGITITLGTLPPALYHGYRCGKYVSTVRRVKRTMRVAASIASGYGSVQ